MTFAKILNLKTIKIEIMRGTEYKHVYALRNKDTGNYLLTYWASSQKHKALFSTRKKAEDAVKWIDDNTNIEIVEL